MHSNGYFANSNIQKNKSDVWDLTMHVDILVETLNLLTYLLNVAESLLRS
jgi:hypothetical protein